MARGQPFQYMPLTELGQALRDVGLAYLQGLKSPEELEKERVLALQAQLAIDQARQKIEAERQAQLARQGLASALESMVPDPTLASILRNAAMMSGDPAITAGFAAMPGAAGGNAAAMAPWFSLYTKKPLQPDDALTVQHQREIAARDQQNALQRVLTEIAAKAAAEEQLLRIKAALAQEAETRPLSDQDLGALSEHGIRLPPGTSVGIAKMIAENIGKAAPMEDIAALVGAVGGQAPDAMMDRAAEGARVPASLAQSLLAQIGRAEAEEARSERDTVPIGELIELHPELGERLREAGVERVSKELLRQATRQDVAAMRAESMREAAQARAARGPDPVKLNDARQLLTSILDRASIRGDKMANAILKDPKVMNQILERAIMRAERDRQPLPSHFARILDHEVEVHDGWFSDTVRLKEDTYPYEGNTLSPQAASQPAPQDAPQAPSQPALSGGPASVLASVPAPNIVEAPRTKAELRALPDGTFIRDPSTGLVFRKQGDRFMLVQGAQK